MGQTHQTTRRQRTLRDVKTASTGRIRSKPPAAGQQYLDQYTLKRDRARWTQLKERAKQMIRGIDKALGKVEALTDTKKSEARDAVRAEATIDLRTSRKRNVST